MSWGLIVSEFQGVFENIKASLQLRGIDTEDFDNVNVSNLSSKEVNDLLVLVFAEILRFCLEGLPSDGEEIYAYRFVAWRFNKNIERALSGRVFFNY